MYYTFSSARCNALTYTQHKHKQGIHSSTQKKKKKRKKEKKEKKKKANFILHELPSRTYLLSSSSLLYHLRTDYIYVKPDSTGLCLPDFTCRKARKCSHDRQTDFFYFTCYKTKVAYFFQHPLRHVILGPQSK